MGEAPSGIGRWWSFLAGALTGITGTLVAVGVTGLLRLDQSPVISVAYGIRDATPGNLAVSLVHLVKHLDKPLLVAGTALGMVLLTGLAGVLHVRRPWLGYGLLILLIGIAAWATHKEADPPVKSLIPLAIGAIVWFLLLPRLTRFDANPEGATQLSRRRILVGGGIAVVASAGVAVAGRALGAGRRQIEQARNLLRLPVSRGVVPEGADLGVSPQPWRTATARFYRIDIDFSPPAVDPEGWELRIHGMVDQPVTLTYKDLVESELLERWVTICCVSNEVGGDLIGNAFWSGVPVRDLLARAGVHPDADAVKQTGADGFTCGTPLSTLTDPDRDALVAIAMNGEALPIAHGFPARLVVPGLYGYVSATKWVTDLEVTRFDKFSAYWTDRGWSPQGPVKTQSRIDVPGDGASVKAGVVRFGGSAWAQHTGIEKVEFQVDGGPWKTAQLGTVPTEDTWVQWVGSATLAKGTHELKCRATDKSGKTQTSVRVDVLPDGATGWDGVTFNVV